MKRRLLAIVLATLMLCTLLSFSILATDIIPGENETEDFPWGDAIPEEPVTYTVTLTSGTGYTVAAVGDSTTVAAGADFSFTVTIADGYEKGDAFAVKANGVALTEANGVYTIAGVAADQTVTVEGVVEAAAKVKIGDIDVNGKINAKDITLLRVAVLNKTTATVCPVSGDIDNNAKVNAKDITLLRIAVLNKTTGELGER